MLRLQLSISRQLPFRTALASTCFALLIAAAGCQSAGPLDFDPLSNWQNVSQHEPASGTEKLTEAAQQVAVAGGHAVPPVDPAAASQRIAAPSPTAGNAAPIAQTAAANTDPNAHAQVAYGQPLVSTHTPIAAEVNCSCCSPNATAGGNRLGEDGCIPPSAAWFPVGGASYVINPQEFLCDGGDRAPHARVVTDGEVAGLGLEDTVVQYTDEYGKTHLTPSNSVCVYAPRFAAVRKITGASTEQLALGPEGVNEDLGPQPIQRSAPSLAMADALGAQHGASVRPIDAFRRDEAGVPIDAVDQPVQAVNPLAVLENLEVVESGLVAADDLAGLTEGTLAANTWTLKEGVELMIEGQKAFEQVRNQSVREVKTYELDGKGRVQIIKVADRRSAKPGETVHFILRFDNVGDGVVRNVVILDNLTTRLQYVEDSQTCTKGARFSVLPNEGSSLRLRWELTEPLAVGEGGVIRFQCIVR